MIDPWTLLSVSSGLALAAAVILCRAVRLRREAIATMDGARATYDHATELYIEATKCYREATEAAERATDANRQAFATMAALAEEGAHYRGTRH